MQQHELKKYVEFTVYEKPDEMKKKNLEICNQTVRKIFFKVVGPRKLDLRQK